MEAERRRKRNFSCAAAFIILAAFLMAGCSQKTKDIDVGELSNKLLTEISYEDELTEIDKETAGMIYDLSGVTVEEQEVYVGSGATAEEIAVLKCASEEDAKTAEEALKNRVEEQKDSFRDYVPEELVKLDKAVVIRKGGYVVLCISNDEAKAKDIINSAFQ